MNDRCAALMDELLKQTNYFGATWRELEAAGESWCEAALGGAIDALKDVGRVANDVSPRIGA